MTQAVILAAGAGTRYGPALNGTAKSLLTVGGRSLLRHQVESLRRIGVERIGIVIGHHAALVRAEMNGVCDYIENPAYARTNSLYSLWLAREWVRGPFMLVNGDVFAPPDFYEQLASLDECALLYDSNSGREPEHMKVLMSGQRLRHLSKEPSHDEIGGENVGMTRFTTKGAEALFHAVDDLVRAGGEGGWAAAAVSHIAAEVSIRCVNVAGRPWVEIDFPEDLHYAQERVWPQWT